MNRYLDVLSPKRLKLSNAFNTVQKAFMISLFLAVGFTGHAQENYFIDKNGEKISLYPNPDGKRSFYKEYILTGDISFTAQYLFYYDKKGKRQKIGQAKVQELHHDSTYYKLLPIGSAGMKRLHQVYASNEKYFITNYFSRANFLYIFDKNGKMVETKEKHSWKRKQDYATLKKIEKYFSDCPELIELIRENIINSDYQAIEGDVVYIKNNMFNNLNNYVCQ